MKITRSIQFTLKGKFFKGEINLNRKISVSSMNKILTAWTEQESKEEEYKSYRRELKKQDKIINLLN